MKKILALVLLAFTLNTSLFAQSLSEERTINTLETIMTVMTGVMMSHSKLIPSLEGVKVVLDETNEVVDITYDNFDCDQLFGEGAPFLDLAVQFGIAIPEPGFSALTGTVIVKNDNSIFVDTQLSGGEVETVKYQLEGEDVIELTLNGDDYSYIVK